MSQTEENKYTNEEMLKIIELYDSLKHEHEYYCSKRSPTMIGSVADNVQKNIDSLKKLLPEEVFERIKSLNFPRLEETVNQSIEYFNKEGWKRDIK